VCKKSSLVSRAVGRRTAPVASKKRPVWAGTSLEVETIDWPR
jgi:hypothetical protein